jgi:RNA polymerase sigma-70 factor (ECF subfamily)
MGLASRLKRKPRAARLLQRASRGDERAIEALYDDNVDGLYGFVWYRVGRDDALAEDVVQETFTRAIDRWESYDPGRGSILSWLCTTSRNVIRDQLRSHRRSDELAATWDRIDESLAQIFAALDRTPLPHEVIARSETRDLVNMTIANLPEKYRTILLRKYIDGASLSSLAANFDMSEVAAKSLLARARRAFRETFSTLSASLAEVQ